MNDKQINQLIIKLNRDTKEGKVTWRVSGKVPPSLGAAEELLNSAYVANVLEQYLRLYKYKYKNYYDEESFEWSEAVRLEFVDPGTNMALWDFPNRRETDDLYETVRYKTSNVESFFDKYLGDEKDEKDSLPF